MQSPWRPHRPLAPNPRSLGGMATARGVPTHVLRALNKTVVITSGTGGTGFIGIQLAKAFGAGHVITSTSGATNIAFAKSLGADQVFDYKEVDIFDALTNNR